MTAGSELWLERMAHRDHLVVCRALRDVAEWNAPSCEVLERVLALTASPVAAVEKSALRTLSRFGCLAEQIQGGLLGQFARRLQDGGGCDFSCCGYAAYYAPVEHYVEALLAIAGAEGMETALDRNVEGLEAASVDEIRFLIRAWP
jgi:hypothetical protein